MIVGALSEVIFAHIFPTESGMKTSKAALMGIVVFIEDVASKKRSIFTG